MESSAPVSTTKLEEGGQESPCGKVELLEKESPKSFIGIRRRQRNFVEDPDRHTQFKVRKRIVKSKENHFSARRFAHQILRSEPKIECSKQCTVSQGRKSTKMVFFNIAYLKTVSCSFMSVLPILLLFR
jgi:hypothetical protein